MIGDARHPVRAPLRRLRVAANQRRERTIMLRLGHRDHWGTLTPRRPTLRPADTPLPRAWRTSPDDEARGSAQDALARDPATALVEAVLFLADEPLPARKIATATALPDAAAARRIIRK